MEALVARGLRKRFKAVTAVDGVDLTVQAGECLALLGPNGAGKTTTVEMLEGLLTPDEGTVQVLGKSLVRERAEIMQDVGVLLQETNLYKRFTVRETLQLFASFFRRSLSVDEVLKTLSLTDKADAQLRTLSGGQKQRAYLGSALINDPKLLFLDEPTTGLDPQARRAIWELLAGLKAQGKSVLLTTHYMDEAEVLADRVAVIDHGKVIAEGSPRQLIEKHCGEQTLWFQVADTDAEGAKAKLKGKLKWLAETRVEQEGLALATRDVATRTQELFAAAALAGVSVSALKSRHSTLEDVFLKLTGRSMRDG